MDQAVLHVLERLVGYTEKGIALEQQITDELKKLAAALAKRAEMFTALERMRHLVRHHHLAADVREEERDYDKADQEVHAIRRRLDELQSERSGLRQALQELTRELSNHGGK
jgi:chromosome segregation ATPase